MSRPSVTLIVAEDDFLAFEAADQFLPKADAQTELVHLEADNSGVAGIEDALSVPSLFNPHRAVLVAHAERLPAAAAARLGELLASASAVDAVAVVAVSERPPTALTKALQDVARVERIGRPRRGELTAWVRARFKAAGLSPERDVPGLLLEALGQDIRTLAGAVEQLGVRAGGRKTITRDDVVALVPKVAEQPSWALYDALLARDGRKAFGVLSSLLAQGNDAIGVLFAVASQNRLVMRAKSALERTPGLRDSQLAQSIGTSPGRAAVLRRQASQCSWDWLVELHLRCAEADFDLKGGDEVRIVGLLPPDMVLQRLLDGALPAVDATRG